MNFLSISSRRLLRTLSVIFATGTFTLCGCDVVTTPSDTDSFASTGVMSGNVHGGQQPVYNATITLYSAGTTGYGSAATPLASTTSDINGNFQFTKFPNGTANAGSAWSCPSSDPNPDPQIYITAIGGNTQGTGVIATNNSASALIAAIGPCSTVTTSTAVQLNEITTVASVFALAQYINPGSGTGAATIGTNGANNSTSKPQGALGLNNAVASIANLANIAIGQPVSSITRSGTATTVANIIVTATPESAKLITIANILAACIDTPASSSNNCADLFASASPPVASTTSLGSGTTFSAAQDTIQAAYYMATNPPDYGTFTSCLNGATTKIACLFNLAATFAPFQTGLAAAPTDWTIGVTYTATGACSNSTSSMFLNGPGKEALDASGNLWFVSGVNVSPNEISELSPVGVPLYCGNATTGYIQGRGLTIDPTGNVWTSYDNTGIVEVPAAGTTAVAWPAAQTVTCNSAITTCTGGVVSPTPVTIVADGNGDVFWTSGSHSTPDNGGLVYELPAVGATATTFKPTLMLQGLGIVGAATAWPSYSLGYAASDATGRIWLASQTEDSSAVSTAYDVFSVNPASFSVTGYSIGSTTSVTFCTAAQPSYTVGQNVVVTGLSTSATLNQLGYTVTSTTLASPCAAFSFTGTVYQATTLTAGSGSVIADAGTSTGYSYTYTSATDTAYGMAVDASNYVYTGDGCCATGDAKRLVRINPTDNAISTNAAISAAGNNGTHATTVDGAGNIWFSSFFPEVGAPSETGPPVAGSGSTYGVGEEYWNGTAFAAISPSGIATGYTCGSSDSGTNNSVAAQCPINGGYQKPALLSAADIAVDPSGNVWVPNTGGEYAAAVSTSYNSVTVPGWVYESGPSSITEIVGAAVPIVTPFSLAAKNGTVGSKP